MSDGNRKPPSPLVKNLLMWAGILLALVLLVQLFQGPSQRADRTGQDVDVEAKIGALTGNNGEVLRQMDLSLGRRGVELRSFQLSAKAGRDGTVERDALTHPWFAGHGYACLRVDMRGNGDSDGLMADEYTPQELQDACEVIDWIAAQPWCSGSVGMTLLRTAITVSSCACGSVWKVVTSTTSRRVHPAAARTAVRLAKACSTCRRKSGSGDPSARLPT
jgi:hypothetical protein